MRRTSRLAGNDLVIAGRRVRLIWRVVGAIVTTGTLIPGSLFARTLIGAVSRPPPPTVQHQTYKRPVSQVVLNLGSGNVTLLPGPAGQVTVERLQRGHPALTQHWDGSTFGIRARCAAAKKMLGISGGGCSLSYTLWIPSGTLVDARTSSGDISVHDLTGSLHLAAGSGDIGLANTTGTVQATDSSGDLVGTGLRSPAVTARLGQGDLRLTFLTAPRAASATTSSGDIDIAVPEGHYRTSAQTGSGDRLVDVITDRGSAAAITARSGSGDVYIHYRH
jgi:Putative adhesin